MKNDFVYYIVWRVFSIIALTNLQLNSFDENIFKVHVTETLSPE